MGGQAPPDGEHMATNNHPDMTNTNRTRWGGILSVLAILVIGTRVTLSLALMPTGLPADGATAANFINNNATWWTTISWLGVLGAIVGAAAAFFLVTRPTATPGGAPGSAFWLVFGIGQLIACGAYLVRGSGLLTLAQNQGTLPVAFQAALSTLGLAGAVATITIYTGLIGVFACEARSRTADAPAWLCWGILTFALVALAGGVASLIPGGHDVSVWLGYGFYPVALGVLLWGLKVGWPTMGFAWDGSTTRSGEES
jgi:hypothetical protein